MIINNMKNNTYLHIFLACFFGTIIVCVPPYICLGDEIKIYDSPLFPFIRTAIENLQLSMTIIGLFLLNFFLAKNNRGKWLVIGLASIILFPIAAILEIIVDAKSHNLISFELLLYGIIDIPALLGAFVGSKS